MTNQYQYYCTLILVLDFISEEYVNTWHTEVWERDFTRSYLDWNSKYDGHIWILLHMDFSLRVYFRKMWENLRYKSMR